MRHKKKGYRCRQIGKIKRRMKRKNNKRMKKTFVIINKVMVKPALFSEQTFFNMKTENEWSPLPMQNTAKKTTYSYAIINRGNYPAFIRAEVSPNGTDFIPDAEITVDQHSSAVVIPARYMKFTRLNICSKEKDRSTLLDVYFQAQAN